MAVGNAYGQTQFILHKIEGVCGCGEVLIRLGGRFPIRGTGIDTSRDFITEAQKRAVGRAADLKIDFKVADAKTYLVEPASLDLVMCLGATHAFGLGCSAYRNAIEQMIPWVKPGGLLLVADGYMKQPAPPEYRRLLGESMPDEMTHAANVSTGKDLGLVPLAAWTSSEEEWDEFEWTYQRIVVRSAVMNPHDPEVLTKVSRRHESAATSAPFSAARNKNSLFGFASRDRIHVCSSHQNQQIRPANAP